MISDKDNQFMNLSNFFPFFMEDADFLVIIISDDNNFKIEYVFDCKFLKQLGYLNDKLIGTSILSLIDFGDGRLEVAQLPMITQNGIFI